MAKASVTTAHAPAPVGPYSQGVVVGDTLYVSGQIPLDPATGRLVEGDVGAQATRVLENLRAIVEAAGFSTAEVVRTTIFLADLRDFPAVNEVYREAFSEPFPARSTVQVSGLPAGALLEIDAIVIRGDS